MGLNPKSSAKILTWCINSALGLLVDYASSKRKPLKQCEMTGYFHSQLSGSAITKRRISRMSHELKRLKYIDTGDGDSIRFTDKAKIRIIDKFVAANPNDGKRRLVSFDIPETKRTQRNAFRRSIKQMGFRQIQKSLWVCDHNIGDMVEVVSREFRVEEYIAYFVVESSNIDKHINTILSK